MADRCTETCSSQGYNFRMAVEDSNLTGDCLPATFDENSQRFEVLREGIQVSDPIVGGEGLTGTVHKIPNHLRRGTRVVFGDLLLNVGPVELNWWWSRILGKPGTPGVPPERVTFTTGPSFDAIPFDMLFDREGHVVIYRHCVVNSAVLRCRAAIDESDDQVLQLYINILGYEEEWYQDPPTNSVPIVWPDPGPSLPTGDRLYWILADSKLETDAPAPFPQEYFMDAFNLMINNNLIPYSRNFLRLTCLQSGGQHFRFQCPTPFTSVTNEYYYKNPFEGRGLISFQGSKNLSDRPEQSWETLIDLPNLVQTRRTPNARNKAEIPLSLDLEGYRNGAVEPITVTNDTTLT